MTKTANRAKASTRRVNRLKPVRRFRVTYWEECGYSAIVEAVDAKSAERLVEAMLADEEHPKGARCAHGDCGVWSADEVKK